MNCVPGDMAVIVRSSRQENIGAIVEVLRPATSNGFAVGEAHFECGTWWNRGGDSFIWVVKATGRKLVASNGTFSSTERLFSDHNLRPIRPQSDDAQDESAAWLPPVPQQVAA